MFPLRVQTPPASARTSSRSPRPSSTTPLRAHSAMNDSGRSSWVRPPSMSMSSIARLSQPTISSRNKKTTPSQNGTPRLSTHQGDSCYEQASAFSANSADMVGTTTASRRGNSASASNNNNNNNNSRTAAVTEADRSCSARRFKRASSTGSQTSSSIGSPNNNNGNSCASVKALNVVDYRTPPASSVGLPSADDVQLPPTAPARSSRSNNKSSSSRGGETASPRASPPPVPTPRISSPSVSAARSASAARHVAGSEQEDGTHLLEPMNQVAEAEDSRSNACPPIPGADMRQAICSTSQNANVVPALNVAALTPAVEPLPQQLQGRGASLSVDNNNRIFTDVIAALGEHYHRTLEDDDDMDNLEEVSSFSSSRGDSPHSCRSSLLLEEGAASDHTGHSPVTPRLRMKILNQQRVDRMKRRRKTNPMTHPLKHRGGSTGHRSCESSFSSLATSRMASVLRESLSSIAVPPLSSFDADGDGELPCGGAGSVMTSADHSTNVDAVTMSSSALAPLKSDDEEEAAVATGSPPPSPLPQQSTKSARKDNNNNSMSSSRRTPKPQPQLQQRVAPTPLRRQKSTIPQMEADGSKQRKTTTKTTTEKPFAASSSTSPKAKGATTPAAATARKAKTPRDSTVATPTGSVGKASFQRQESVASSKMNGRPRTPAAAPLPGKNVATTPSARRRASQGVGKVAASSTTALETSPPPAHQQRPVTIVPQRGALTASGGAITPIHPVKQVLIPLLATPQEKERTVTIVFDLDETLCNNRMIGTALLRPGAIKVLQELRALYPSPEYKHIRRPSAAVATSNRLYQDAMKGSVLAPVTHAASSPRKPQNEAEEDGLRLEIVLWTASVEYVARPVVEKLDPDHSIFDQAIYRDIRWYCEEYTKDLRRLGRSMDRVVIIENAPTSVELNRRHAILVNDFITDRSDRQLFVVKSILAEWMEKCHELVLKQAGKLQTKESSPEAVAAAASSSLSAPLSPSQSRSSSALLATRTTTISSDGGESLVPRSTPQPEPSADPAPTPTRRSASSCTSAGVFGRLSSRAAISTAPALTLEEESVITTFLARHRYISPQTNFVRMMAVTEVMRRRAEQFAAMKRRAAGATGTAALAEQSTVEDTPDDATEVSTFRPNSFLRRKNVDGMPVLRPRTARMKQSMNF